MKTPVNVRVLVGQFLGALGIIGFLLLLVAPNIGLGLSFEVSFDNGKYVSRGELGKLWFLDPIFALFCIAGFLVLRKKVPSEAKTFNSPKSLVLKRAVSLFVDIYVIVSIVGSIFGYIVTSIELNDFSLGGKSFSRVELSWVDLLSVLSILTNFGFVGFLLFFRGTRGIQTPGTIIVGIRKEFAEGSFDAVDMKRCFQFALVYVVWFIFIPYYFLTGKSKFLYDRAGTYVETSTFE